MKVLFVDDEAAFRKVLAKEMIRMGHEVTLASSGAEALRLLEAQDLDVALLDIKMPGMDGLETLKLITQRGFQVEVIMLTGHGTVESAVEAMKLGAYDYVTKPCKLNELSLLLQKAHEKRQLKQENVSLRRLAMAGVESDVMVGESEAMKALLATIEKVAATDSTVLIEGESGTGKELVARALHRYSHRAAQPFVVVNCPAIQDTLFESEVFGHVKGAFTGAADDKLGLLEAAHRGTVFLDEVGELSLPVQAKLLRTLESGEIRRVGDLQNRYADIRVVAGTNRDLSLAVKAGQFRTDLYFRLHIVHIQVPALRDRKSDIPSLVTHFLSHCGAPGRSKTFAPEALAALGDYDWPGNVRELRNTIEHLAVLTEHPVIRVSDLPAEIVHPKHPSAPPREFHAALSEVERDHILSVLAAKGGNKTEAAKALGIALKTLYNKLKTYGAQ